MKRCILNFVAIFWASLVIAQDAQYVQNRLPLKPAAYTELPPGAITPQGWLREQLLRMSRGLTGDLDVKYSTVLGKRNGWLGGDGDVWARGPYWLDGLVPLAYILDDPLLKAKAKPWIEWSLNHQDTSGYFGPVPLKTEPADEPGLQRTLARDWWPKMVMLKVLQQYYEATGDTRVLKLMSAYFRYQLRQLPQNPLDHWSFWGAQRGGDNLQVVYWLYNHTGEAYLLKLGKLIHAQTTDWTHILTAGDLLKGYFTLHGVNLAQGIKEPVIYYQQFPETSYLDAVERGFHDIDLYHGQPQGMFGADEWLHGRGPTQGSELCSAVEMMFSLESMLKITGNVGFADHLEKIAFNALPTQSDSTYRTRQYYQQPNQVVISRNERNFYTGHDGTDNCYGLLTGYACCTCNMHQGWPKFTQNLWYATAHGGLAAIVYAPSVVNARVRGGHTVKISENTNYPFDETLSFTVAISSPVRFDLSFRLPMWCENPSLTVGGKAIILKVGEHSITIDRTWKTGDVVVLKLPMHITTRSWNENAISVERGPLVYALGLEGQSSLTDKHDESGQYVEIFPKSPWNYALTTHNGKIEFSFELRKSTGVFPWTPSQSPVAITVPAKKIVFWNLYQHSAGPLPYSPLKSGTKNEGEFITLIPYGCTALRVSEFPQTE